VGGGGLGTQGRAQEPASTREPECRPTAEELIDFFPEELQLDKEGEGEGEGWWWEGEEGEKGRGVWKGEEEQGRGRDRLGVARALKPWPALVKTPPRGLALHKAGLRRVRGKWGLPVSFRMARVEEGGSGGIIWDGEGRRKGRRSGVWKR